MPTAVRLMLRFGFFDEELLDDEHLGFLYNAEDNTRSAHPIVNVVDWLQKVGDKGEPCSVDEMGMTYFEKLKNDNKNMGWKRESDLPEEYNTTDKRIHYEIQNFLEVNTRLTSGTPTTAFPILTRYQITMPLERSFVTAKRLGAEIDRVLSIDFSAFHREVIINDEERNIIKEFVQNQVIPNFIIVPSIGTKVMMWQDVSTRNKSSTGRLVVPVFATADLFTLVLEAVAAFRWELTKTIMGAGLEQRFAIFDHRGLHRLRAVLQKESRPQLRSERETRGGIQTFSERPRSFHERLYHLDQIRIGRRAENEQGRAQHYVSPRAFRHSHSREYLNAARVYRYPHAFQEYSQSQAQRARKSLSQVRRRDAARAPGKCRLL